MLTIQYLDEVSDLPVIHCSDFDLLRFCELIYLEHKSDIYGTYQESVIIAFRLLVKQGKIPHTDIKFTYKNNVMFCDYKGTLDWYPRGFCDTIIKMEEELIDWS